MGEPQTERPAHVCAPWWEGLKEDWLMDSVGKGENVWDEAGGFRRRESLFSGKWETVGGLYINKDII